MLSEMSPTTQLPSFWNIFDFVLNLTKNEKKKTMNNQKYDKIITRELQKKCVLACQNYQFARESWEFLIVSALLDLPRIGNIITSNRKKYLPFPSPVTTGTKIYIDANICIMSIEGELGYLPLTGIRTSKSDTSVTSLKYLNFQVSDPCTVFLCWPEKCQIPKWVDSRSFF